MKTINFDFGYLDILKRNRVSLQGVLSRDKSVLHTSSIIKFKSTIAYENEHLSSDTNNQINTR